MTKLKTQNDEKMHYKITIFGAWAPYPRLIYWIASSISQGKKDDMSSNPGWLSPHFVHKKNIISYHRTLKENGAANSKE